MILSFLDPNTLTRTYRDPVAWAMLAVDVFPIVAILTMGWGATPLVFLYWLENLIIGVFALLRMIATSVKESVIGLAGMAFLGPFFIVHYGMFCFVHGVFLNTFASMGPGASPDFLGPFGLVDRAVTSGANMQTFLIAIIALQAFLYVRDYLLRGQYQGTNIGLEMVKPYGRIVVLHVGLFVGAGAMAAFGEPLWGVLGLILLRALWGVYLSTHRRLSLDAAVQSES